ncbi:hypothetical protein [Kutzneria sp. CA-103260]|uniref:hypothetical protein n=1 Tax=Kutzneria sp. CA-103260 TaxID=2802641 RepID=UPI001BA7E3E7|nr:hypothetical protein [Kutzneria sp. CA-103260]QUQ67435.1 hypothetical protein JJ691_51690 [Kutzneria sp. CA-103260]
MRASTAVIAAVALAACLTAPASAATITGHRLTYRTTATDHQDRHGSLVTRLTPTRRPTTATPHFPLTPLQIDAVDLAGQPADTSVYLVNTDVVTDEQADVPVAGGLGRVAVPAGHYFALASFVDTDASGKEIADRVAVVNDFTVAPAPAVNVVTVDERTATSLTGATTPKPATQDASLLQLVRTDAHGSGALATLAQLGGPNPPLYISPTPKAIIGGLHYVYQWDGRGDGYRYDVAFPSDNGIPADNVFAVRPEQLATVTQRFDLDRPASDTGSFLNGAADPVLNRYAVTEVGSEEGQAMPGLLTQYLGTADGGQWAQSVATPNLGAEYDGEPVTYAAKQSYQVAWGHGPLAPGFGNHQDPFAYCGACTAGGTLGLQFNELNDSVTTHTGQSDSAMDHITVSWNGKKIADADDIGATAKLPTTKGTLQAVMDTSRDDVVHATTTHTEITVKVTGSGPTMPSGGTCAGTGPCRILPALAVHYDLAADMTGTSTSATQTMRLDISHLSYYGVGSHSRITKAAVSVSFDGGQTWQPADLNGSNGKYTAKWRNSLSTKGISLRVSAADAARNSISQTIANAYTYVGSQS